MSRGNQLLRQWQLLRILQQFRVGISIDELAERVGYKRRTVERDLAMLKEAGNIIKDLAPGESDPPKAHPKASKAMTPEEADSIASALSIKKSANETGVKALKSKVADQVFVSEEHISLGVAEPTRHEQRPIHVMTAQGPRTSIKRTEIVDNVEIAFTIRRCKGRGKQAVSESVLMAILDYAQTVGLGADRSQGYGQFEILSVEKV